MCISLKTILGDINTFWAKLLIGFLQNIFIIGIPQITNFYDNNPSITTSKLKKKKYIYIQSSTKCSEINLMKRGDREQLKAIVVLFNKVRRLWLFFFFFFYCRRLGCGGGRAVEEIEREMCKERERGREKERESYKFFGFRNKYGMY